MFPNSRHTPTCPHQKYRAENNPRPHHNADPQSFAQVYRHRQRPHAATSRQHCLHAQQPPSHCPSTRRGRQHVPHARGMCGARHVLLRRPCRCHSWHHVYGYHWGVSSSFVQEYAIHFCCVHLRPQRHHCPPNAKPHRRILHRRIHRSLPHSTSTAISACTQRHG